MAEIVCFGDSNTFGFNPNNGKRYDENTRWSGILKSRLKDKFQVIEAGCNNRTCYSINPDSDELTGFKALPKYLNPTTNYLILAVGLNDLQKFYSSTDNEIKDGITNLIKIAREISPNIKIIILAPSKIKECILNSYFSTLFNKDAIEKSIKMNRIYSNVAKENNCKVINLDNEVETSEIDGLHYLETEHKKIAELIINTCFKF